MQMRNLIKIYRWEAGLKQYELAARLGCSPPYLSLVENFRVEPDGQFKERLSEILRVPKEALFPKRDPRTIGEWATARLRG
jgi:transcriptional regulator with XRE-family HTH domain